MGDFSGYIAMDELYDGPFCILSIVDNHTCRRLMYEVLDHNPTHQDIKRFLLRFRSVLEKRHLELYCLRLSFPVFIPSECESFPLAGFAIPVNISSVFGKSFCTTA